MSDLPFLGQGRIKLWCRAENVLRLNGIGSSPDEIRAAIESETISPKRTRNYGMKTHKRLCELVGLPIPDPRQARLESLKKEMRRLEALIFKEPDVNPNLPW